MAFQEQVNKYRAAGVVGQAATPDQSVYTAKNYLSDGTPKIGCFAFAKADAANACTLTAGTATEVLGLVERVIAYPINDVTQTAIEVIPNGYPCTIAVRGDYYVNTSAAATVGQAVFASTTDGSIKTAEAGSTQSGFIETPWVVKDVLEAGTGAGLILISNWGTSVKSSTASVGA